MKFEMPSASHEGKDKEQTKKGFLEKIKKSISIFMATGIMVLGSELAFEARIVKGYTPDRYIEYSKVENELQQEKIREHLAYLEKKYSVAIMPYLEEGDRAAQKAKNIIPSKTEINGFEEVGLDNDKLGELWSSKYYPKKTIKGELGGVYYYNAPSKNVSDYNIPGQSGGSTEDSKDSIYFHDFGRFSGKRDVAEALDWYFSHEIGHINDWVNKNNMSPEERVEFLNDISSSFEKPGSFRDALGYIDEINNKNKQKENYYKTREYWATLCEYYLSFPELAEKVFSEEEKELIKKWLIGVDDSFNSSESLKMRRELIDKM